MNYTQLSENYTLYCENKQLLTEFPAYEENFSVQYAYHSTGIEGNRLSLQEVELILIKKNIAGSGKKLENLYEVINHNNTYNYIKDCIAKKLPLSEKIIKEIHFYLTKDILLGGNYRNENVYILGAKFKPPSCNDMYKQLKYYYSDLSKIYKNDPLALAAWTHAEFVRIHPFLDGNGKTSRMIMNYQLLTHGFPAIIIPKEDKSHYFTVLDKFVLNNNINPFKDYLAYLMNTKLIELNTIIATIKKNKAINVSKYI